MEPKEKKSQKYCVMYKTGSVMLTPVSIRHRKKRRNHEKCTLRVHFLKSDKEPQTSDKDYDCTRILVDDDLQEIVNNISFCCVKKDKTFAVSEPVLGSTGETCDPVISEEDVPTKSKLLRLSHCWRCESEDSPDAKECVVRVYGQDICLPKGHRISQETLTHCGWCHLLPKVFRRNGTIVASVYDDTLEESSIITMSNLYHAECLTASGWNLHIVLPTNLVDLPRIVKLQIKHLSRSRRFILSSEPADRTFY